MASDSAQSSGGGAQKLNQVVVPSPLRKGSRANSDLDSDAGQESAEPESWMVAYLDVITLLLAFFIMMIAFADFSGKPHATDPPPETEAPEEAAGEAAGATEVVTDWLGKQGKSMKLAASLTSLSLSEGFEATREGETLIINLGPDLLFGAGEAVLSKHGQELLDKIALQLVLATAPGDDQVKLSVEGHTDNRVVISKQYPSYWELSAGRATVVLRHLTSQGIASQNIRALAYGDSRPVAPNASEEGRRQNRRVTILIHPASSLASGLRAFW